ncbi:hypothetical protein V8E51_012799 [Hyaloscypha variabilis]
MIEMDDAEWFIPLCCGGRGAIPLTWNGVPPEKLKEPPLMPEDFFAVLKHAKVSVGSDEIKNYDEWTKKYGLEGA